MTPPRPCITFSDVSFTHHSQLLMKQTLSSRQDIILSSPVRQSLLVPMLVREVTMILMLVGLMLAEAFHPLLTASSTDKGRIHPMQHRKQGPFLSRRLERDAALLIRNVNAMHTQEQKGQLDERPSIIPDWITIFLHAIACLVAAFVLCAYEDFDCNHLKPNVTGLRTQAINGLGHGKLNRLDYSDILVSQDDISLQRILNYNEIMEEHRLDRVPRWQRQVTEESFRGAIVSVYNAIDSAKELKSLAQNYDWEEMRNLIKAPILSTDLQEASAILRGATLFLSSEARSEIGFDWGR